MIEVKKKFIFINIILIVFLIFFYSTRFVYYYLESNDKIENKTNYFADILKKTINVKDSNGGLYMVVDKYVYKNNVNDNYLWYSGQLFRILKINDDDTIDIISEPISILNGNNYIDSYLNEFYNKLDKEYLVSFDECTSSFDDIDSICEDKINTNISLLDIEDYKISGSDSFLSDNSSYFLINKTSDNKYWYVNNLGNLSISEDYNSFLIRPVLRLKSDITLISGTGTKTDPYIIKEKRNMNIGEYVTFNSSLFRITSLDNGITIIKDECLSDNNGCINYKYGDTSDFLKSDLYEYLNETYYNSIVNKDYIINKDYNISSYLDYNYTIISKVNAFITISNVGDYYISNKTNSYLLTNNELNSIYSINDNSNYYLTLPSSIKKIYPVLTLDSNLKIDKGSGTYNDPYILTR